MEHRSREWLYNKYMNEKLSMIRIAKLCGNGKSTIHRWLRRHNIVSRSVAEAAHLVLVNHCDLSREAIEWINGELLGDGCLISCSSYSARFSYSSEHSEYINYVSNTLQSFGVEQSGKIHEEYRKGSKTYNYHYKSLSYEELLDIRKRWYPEGKKIIPRDIRLTSLMVRQWHIGDGCLRKSKKRGNANIELCTNGFTIFDVERLVKQLNNLGFKAARRDCRNTIGISTCSTKNFLDYIGSSPVDCYNYKFAY